VPFFYHAVYSAKLPPFWKDTKRIDTATLMYGRIPLNDPRNGVN
jgi:hypothetical protein